MNTKLLAVALSVVPLSLAQLAPPNAAGVTMGHLHIKSRDVAAQRKLWIDVLDGKPGKLAAMETARFPGVIVIYEKGEPAGGTVGTVVNHLGFKVRSLEKTLARAAESGITVESKSKTNAFLMGPDDVRVEIFEDPSITTTAAHHHIHFFDTAVDDTKAWYVKMFAAAPGRRANFEAADLPGVNLTFAPSLSGPTVGTKGRAVDHIGFEVKDLEAFAKRLEAAGVKLDVPYRKIPSLGIALVFLTDPFGTYIELTEGLDKL